MGILFWRKKKKPQASAEKQEEENMAQPRTAPWREELVVIPRKEPAVFEFGKGSGIRMSGVCGVGEADRISACVWRVDAREEASTENAPKPDFHIEF